MIKVLKSYILDEIEFVCLLSYMDIHNIYGFKVATQRANLRKNICYAIYDLCKKGYVRYENKVIIDDDIRKCLCIIKDCHKIISIKRKDNNEQSIIYVSNKYKDIVIMRQGLTREKDLIMCSIYKSELFDYWIDEGYLINDRYVELLENRDIEKYIEAREDDKKLEISVLIVKDENGFFMEKKEITVYDYFMSDCTENRNYILNRRNMDRLLELG